MRGFYDFKPNWYNLVGGRGIDRTWCRYIVKRRLSTAKTQLTQAEAEFSSAKSYLNSLLK